MRFSRRAAILSFLIVLAMMLAVGAYAVLQAYAARGLERIGSLVGGEVSYESLSPRFSGITVRGISLTRPDGRGRCEQVVIPLTGARVSLPLDAVAVEGCTFEHSIIRSRAARRTATQDEQGGRNAVARTLSRMSEFARHVTVSDIAVTSPDYGSLGFSELTLALDAESSEISLSALRVESGAHTLSLPLLQIAFDSDGHIDIGPVRELLVDGLDISWDTVAIAADLTTADVTEVSVVDAGGLLSVAFSRLGIDRQDSLRISAEDGVVDFFPVTDGEAHTDGADAFGLVRHHLAQWAGVQRPVEPEAHEERTDATDGSSVEQVLEEREAPGVMACIEGADCWEPSLIARALTDLMDHLEHWPELRSRLLEMERPPFEAALRRVQLRGGGESIARIETMELTPELFQIDAGTRGVSFQLGIDLVALDALEASASGLDLSEVGAWLHPDLNTRGSLGFDGTLRLQEGRLEANLHTSASDSGFDWPAVSPEPVDLEVLDVQLRLEAGRSRCEDDCGDHAVARSVTLDADVTYGGVEASTSLTLDEAATDDWNLDWTASLDEAVPCTRLWRLIPEGLLPTLGHRGLRFEGETEWVLGATYRFGDPWSFEPTSELFPGTCRISWITPEFDPAQLNSNFYVHHVTEGVEREDIVVGPGTDSYVRLHTLPVYVPAAMYLSEEINFYNGVGVSLNLIRRAVSLNIARGRYAYGGSTIMQQLVKNLFLSRSKTLSRKLEEALLVWAMLERVEKDRILELYVNCIEFAPDVYGIAAASEHYFARPPQWLTPLEAIYLANLKPSPASAVNHYRRGHSPIRGWWQERTRVMLQRLVQYTGSVHPDEVDFYAPYIVALTGSPAWRESGYEPIERPEWAVLGGQAPVPEGIETPTTPKE
jgi:hypothetical protein